MTRVADISVWGVLYLQLINRDPDFRIGCGSSTDGSKPVSEIKEHPFFSKVSTQTHTYKCEMKRFKPVIQCIGVSYSRITCIWPVLQGHAIDT